jgi:cytochrome oxidase Cu insertion factor (SCO1/SenC/PrrC family)
MSEIDIPRSRIQLWLMVSMVTGVFILAFLVMPGNEEEKARLLDFLGTSNRGTLLIPTVPIVNVPSMQGEKPWRWNEQKPKWRLILPVVNGCDRACRDMLYISRQVHKRLDTKAHRVARVLLNLGPRLDKDTMAFLRTEHLYLKLVSADRNAFARLLEPTNADWQAGVTRLFLLDQRSELMMYYTPENQGVDILADLRHLLKYSPEL